MSESKADTRLDGRVVIITGAGNGIGRAHALACARAGARVLVNDLGGSVNGDGADGGAAAAVAAEIRAAGGEALANTDSVTDPAGCVRMVDAARAAWGRVDAVINNAGILRDVTFRKMTPEQWSLVLAVHLDGTVNMTRAALPALLENPDGGAIINTTSYSGLIGNFGQANYGAAKAGIYGFSRVLALELQKSRVTVNCIAPVAHTRMTENIPVVDAGWTADHIAPVAVFLASPAGRAVTGKVFGVQGARLHVYEMKVNDGVEKDDGTPWTPEEIAARLDDIQRFEAAPAAATAGEEDLVTEVFSCFPAGFHPDAAPGWSAVLHWVVGGGTAQTVRIDGGVCQVRPGLHGTPTCTVKAPKAVLLSMFKGELDPQKAFLSGKASADSFGDLLKLATSFDFSKVAAAWAARSGAGAAPATPDAGAPATPDAGAPAAPPAPADLTPAIGKVYHGGYVQLDPAWIDAYAAATNDGSVVYAGPDAVAPPMLHVRLLRDMMFAIIGDPSLDLDVLRLVHGEHDAVFHRPLRPWDLVQLRARLDHVEQKAKGLLVEGTLIGIVEGEVAVEARSSFFIRGQMRFPVGYGKRAAPPAPAPPDAPPSHTFTWAVDADQSLRYAAASLDDNPIHTDPATAQAAGLPDVILHGLCTMAMSGRGLVQAFAWGDARKLARLAVRFSKPVLNGSTLTTRAWSTAEGVVFEVRDAGGDAVITNGLAVFRS